MNIDEQIAVLEAYRDGKTIEFKGAGYTWRGNTVKEGEYFDFKDFTYRVKPELPDILHFILAENVEFVINTDFTLTSETPTQDSEQYALVDESKLIYLVGVGLTAEQLVIFKRYSEARTFEKQHVSITSCIKQCLVLDEDFKPQKLKSLKGPEE